MTIGVRGTAFDLAVRAGTGESMVVMHEGQTDLCDATHRCMEAHPGSMSVATSAGIRAVPPGQDRNARLQAYFPLVKSQTGLDPGFVVQVPGDLGNNDTNDPRHDNTGEHPGDDTKPPANRNPDGRPPHS
jgi:hypothetical protein